MTSNEIIRFPESLLLGVGSSAYQVEGAWDEEGKAPSIWDAFFHSGENEVLHEFIPLQNHDTISDDEEPIDLLTFFKGFQVFKSTTKLRSQVLEPFMYSMDDGGMTACDSYHKTEMDIQLLKDLGVQVYRFSLSWPRLLPDGDDQNPNQAGIEYYNNLIQKLLDNNIQPLITIYHWDLPQSLQKIGGWANSNIVRYFTNYCEFVFKTFGDKVKLWSTVNEPRLIAEGYGGSSTAPALGENFSGIADYMVIHNLLLAHGYAYRLYNENFRETQQGQISLCLDTLWFFPADPNDEEHKKAADLAFQSFVGIFVQPLLTGEYPKIVVESIKATNKLENKHLTRIIQFTDQEKKILIGAYDFVAFNYYFSLYAKPNLTFKEEDNLKTKDLKVQLLGFKGDHKPEDTNAGFRNLVDWFDEVLNHPKIFVCENGFAEDEGVDKSLEKKRYHYDILREVDQALKRNINIIGYCVWSFMDSLEWASGYKSKFGIYGVDFNDPSRPRYKKENNFAFFQNLFKTKTLPPPEIE
ncbi:lactase/phlorizin hydrolase-like [Adelges cooleyi]|uniref:lactase/phlorizin hydrolase-like n=1 Tax=Adelges cooleyi TaxID=133065 RepID=UPI00217FD6EF|nr:lactase/phlorizin hydrolase-like [Adelges cooleyi]